jgi:multiple antibiotic resistance protein
VQGSVASGNDEVLARVVVDTAQSFTGRWRISTRSLLLFPPDISRSCSRLVSESMSQGLLQFGLTAFVTLTVVVDPFSVVPIFIAMTRQMKATERKAIVTRAVTIAFTVTLFFLLAGRAVLTYLGVTVHAFAISGGILLFATALPMLFGQRPALQSSARDQPGIADENIAIFPLAIPLLSGPGTITTILLLTDQANGSPQRLAVLVMAIVMVYLLTLLVLYSGEWLISHMGEGKVHIISRVLGIVLAAVAVQYMLNGITGHYNELMRRSV